MSPRVRRDRIRRGWSGPDDALAADPAGLGATSTGGADSQRADVPWPGHDLQTSGCTDYVVGADLGELAPGHRLVVRGVCLDGGRLWLYYAWTPGLTDSMGLDSGVWLAVDYDADVPPADLSYAGSYDTAGGEFSEGEVGYDRPPAGARRVWFDFYATTGNDHRACRLTIDLVTGRVQVDR